MDSVYLDSTIPSYLHDGRPGLQTFIEVTQRWWQNERERFELWISEETINEITAGRYPRKDKVMQTIASLSVLTPTETVVEIASVYMENHLMPKSFGGDALHLAYASYYKLDFLLTWNCNHLANANKKQHIATINSRLKLFTPEIVTPMELFTETKT